MGYGIKLLAIQSHLLPTVLDGKQDKWVIDEVKMEVNKINEVNDKLFRLSGYTIMFIGDCKILFNILEEEDGEFWDNIYSWKSKYYEMEWCELKNLIEPLIDEYSKGHAGYDEIERQETLETIKTLWSVNDYTKIFTMS